MPDSLPDIHPSQLGTFLPMLPVILKDIASNTEFVWLPDAEPTHIMMSEDGKFSVIGVCIPGEFRGEKAVLKVRGISTGVDEGMMIKFFSTQTIHDPELNTIRPPFLFDYLPWDAKKGYEALVLEDIGDNRLVSIPPQGNEMAIFFNLYDEYVKLCRKVSWLEKPQTDSLNFITKRLKFCLKNGEEYRKHAHLHAADTISINRAVSILHQAYKDIPLTFQHAPFTPWDLFYTEDSTESDTLILLSNQTWGWYPPFFDSISGYYHHLMTLLGLPGMTEIILEEQLQMWNDGMKMEAATPELAKQLQLMKLAEAVAWLSYYALLIPEEHTLSEYVVAKARENLLSLLAVLNITNC